MWTPPVSIALSFLSVCCALFAGHDARAAAQHDPQASFGQRVYEHRCRECHGPGGHGDGPNAFVLPLRPFDLTSSHMVHEMTDDEIFQVVTNGIRSHSMPSFKRRLTVDERHAVVAYVRTLQAEASTGSGTTASAAHEADHEMEHETEHEMGHEMGHEHHEHGPHVMTRAVAWPMTREASGTAWVPDSTPMLGLMRMDHGFMFMLHGDFVAGVNTQATARGDQQATSVSWVMPMVSHDVPGGNLEGRAMLSLEPLLLPADGYPLLLQTGETVRGAPLHDRQHPHDLVMELAALFRTAPVLGASGELYAALAGEPALGPAAYPHRMSAMGDPLAPLSHHWLDSTHIAFGVFTAGIGSKVMKVEASMFNGREPDEDRLDLDLAAPSSTSFRVQVLPTNNLALQASAGYLIAPEALHPDENVVRTTASLTWNQPLEDGNWATMVAFGNNHGNHGALASSAALAESTLEAFASSVFFARVEVVGKDTKDLVVPGDERITTVTEARLGYQYVFDPAFEFVPALGVEASAAAVDDGLARVYGTHVPVGAMAYVLIRGAGISTR